GVDRVSPGVVSINRKTMTEPARDRDDHGIEASVHIRQRSKDVVEPRIACGMRSKTSGIGSSAGLPIRTIILELVLRAVEGISRHDAVQINGADKFAASTALIAEFEDQVSRWFKLHLQRVHVHIRIRLVRKRGK